MRRSPDGDRGSLRATRVALGVAVLVAFAASASSAQAPGSMKPAADSSKEKDPHAVQPERPTVATHAGTVAPGWVELETGVERDHYAPATTGFVAPTVLKFGIADNVQFSLFGGAVKPADASAGIGDIAGGIKWRLVDDGPRVGDFAVLPSVNLPAGSATPGRGTGTTDVSIRLVSSHSFGSVAMDLKAGYTHRSGDGSSVPTSATVWTASFGGPFGGSSVGWVGELYGYPATSGPSGQASIVALLAGPTLQIETWLAVDAGIIIPLSGPQPKAIYAGAVYNIGQLWNAR
jgi:hypothetical protein